MEPGALKLILTSLALPPLSLIALGLLGLILLARKNRLGLTLVTLSLALLGLLSCHGTAVWLASNALPQFAPLSLATLKASKVQAIVVLGGGLLPGHTDLLEWLPSASGLENSQQVLREWLALAVTR